MSWNQLRNCNDMDEGLIARRYALAMLKVAQKYNAAEEVYQKMKTFEQNYISHPDLHKVYQIGRIKIITAVALKQETLDRIKKLVTDRTSRQIEFVEKVDPAIIGGFVLRVNSMQLDYSVGGELKKIAKQLK